MDIEEEGCFICWDEDNKQELMGKADKFNCNHLTCRGVFLCSSCKTNLRSRALELALPLCCPRCHINFAKDEEEEFERTKKNAILQKAWALDLMGEYYDIGKFVKKNNQIAFEYYYKASSLGNANSQNCVGIMYKEGRGVVQNDELSFIFYKKAAEQGLTMAQYNLATCYLNGVGTERDYEKAVQYFKLSEVEKASQFNLGFCYANGYGVKKNLVLAIYSMRCCVRDHTDKRMYEAAKSNVVNYFQKASLICAACGLSEGEKLPLMCGKCKSAFYCNKECQAQYWKSGHKQECKLPK